MNKKFYMAIFVIASFAVNCIALDTAGLAYKGSEAKKVIEDAAVQGDLIYWIFNAPQNQIVPLTMTDRILLNVTSKIDDSKYYSKTDVINCADDIRNYAYVLISDAFDTMLLSGHCSNLKPHGPIIK